MTADELFQEYISLHLSEKERFDKMIYGLWQHQKEHYDDLDVPEPTDPEMEELTKLAYRVSIAQQLMNLNGTGATPYISEAWIKKNILKFE